MFNSSNHPFRNINQFGNELKKFIGDEAARFTTESNEAASASLDESAEMAVRFSAESNKVNIEQQNQVIGECKEKPDAEKKDNAKKEKSKETKKLGAKTAVASMLKAKKDMSNDLVSEKVTGDAVKDGMSGLIQTFVEFVSPVRWMKGLMMKLGAFLAPYIAIFMMIATVVIIIVMLIYALLQPIADVGGALDQYLSVYTVDSDTFSNVPLTDAEIDAIVESSGSDETQEQVIRFALEKVGFAYSQSARTSGYAYDCSSLVYYCWLQGGEDISYGGNYPPTAAAGASMLDQRGKTLTMMNLQPGDLVYYGGSDNGRNMGIYHVALYVGDGKAVEALNTKYGVVYQTLRTKNAIMVCRPNM